MASENQIFEKIPQASLAQQALRSIRQAIMNGDLTPGQPLREMEIAAQMGISRVPVREALLVLEEEGLVERVPFKGTFVSTFSRQNVEELYSLRTVLECFAIDLLLPRLTPAILQELREHLGQMRAAASAGDAEAVNTIDIQFHEALLQHAGHKRLLETWRDLRMQIRRVVVAGNILNLELETIVRNHLPIMAALEAGDIADAKRQIELHISDSARRVIDNWSRIDARFTQPPS